MTRIPGAVSAVEPAELLTAAAGTGALLTGGIYAAFHLMVLPALDRLAPEQAARTMRAINAAAERPPFLSLFFGTAGDAVASGVLALGDDGDGQSHSGLPWFLIHFAAGTTKIK